MAKIVSNPLIASISGKLGKQIVFRQMKDGRTIISAMPDFSNREFSERQLAHQNRFKQAAAYARAASKTNPIYAGQARSIGKTAYKLALTDWFNPPVIHKVARYPGHIRIDATDDVKVARVCITISDVQGQILEEGEAALTQDAWWEFNTTAPTETNITVEVYDLAGNKTIHEA